MDDSPNLPDHDFPTAAGNKISPVGYMVLESKFPSDTMTEDELGRKHYIFPRSGESHIVNTVQKFHPLTIQTHVNDLTPLLRSRAEKGKTLAVLIVDGGPDWNPRSWAVWLYLTRLFRDSNLDLLCSTSYAPGHSAYNPIEHLWAPLSKQLTGVILPDRLDGEVPPSKQTNLSAEQRRRKEGDVFDVAMATLNEYWDGSQFDGHRVNCRYQSCLDAEAPYTDYEEISELLKHPGRLRTHKELMSELKFALSHGDRRNGEFTIMKCVKQSCRHCSSKPTHPEAAAILEEIRRHGGMPSPSLSNDSDHFCTFTEAMESAFIHADTGMPRYKTKHFGRCSYCPSYVFMSDTDAVNHMNIFHDVSPKVTKAKLANRKKNSA